MTLRRFRPAHRVSNSMSGATVIKLGLVAAVVIVLYFLLRPSMYHGPESRWRSNCKENLKQIGLALHNYHETYKSLPPAWVADAEGRPLYSWRVLILPFLERRDLYDKLHLDESWHSPHNRPLLDVDMPVFRCPTDRKMTGSEGDSMTNYVAVVGPETVWPASDACSIDDITDGTSNTILVVEVANSGIHWAEPRDLHVTQMAPRVNPKGGMGVSSSHEGGAHVLLVDGSTRFVHDHTPAERLRAWLTRAGGEVVDEL